MGCGVSKFDLLEKRPNPVKFVYPKNEAPIVNEKDGMEEETESLVSAGGRKSVSSQATERGFLKRVFAGNNASNVTELPIDQGRRSVSSSPPVMMENGLFAKETGLFGKDSDVVAMSSEKASSRRCSVELGKEEVRRVSVEMTAHMISVEMAAKKKEMERGNVKMGAKDEMSRNEKNTPNNNGEEFVRENSLLFPPGSPSFRIYCVINEKDGTRLYEEEGDEGNKVHTGMEKKGSDCDPTKRRRRTNLLKGVLQRGGSAGMKSLLHASHRSSSASVQDTCK